MYSLDGFLFEDYENEKNFTGNTDQNTKIRHDLKPFYARALRLYPLEFSG
jgi:hypothetical protein